MRRARRAGLALALGVAAALAAVAPAGADPARPTDHRSTIDAVDPPADAVDLEVVGGDAFLRLRADPGTEVVVAGYQGEPYLRIRGDGVVEENQRSPATYLNADRYGDTAQPPGLSPTDAPEWATVDDDGEHAWHDHRVHWMSPTRKAGVEPGDVVQEWLVPLTVDGEATEVRGTLRLEAPVSPLPWAVLAVAGAGIVLVAGGWRRGRASRSAVPVAAGAAVVAAALATLAGGAEWRSVPDGAGGSPVTLVVPAVALLGGVVGAGAVLLRRTALAGLALLVSAAALLGWAALRLSVLWKPVLPTDLAPAVDRAATALALGVGLAVAALTIRSGAVAPAPLAPDGAPTAS